MLNQHQARRYAPPSNFLKALHHWFIMMLWNDPWHVIHPLQIKHGNVKSPIYYHHWWMLMMFPWKCPSMSILWASQLAMFEHRKVNMKVSLDLPPLTKPNMELYKIAPENGLPLGDCRSQAPSCSIANFGEEVRKQRHVLTKVCN